MNLQELEQQLALQEQHALDLSLVSTDRVSWEALRAAWAEARELEENLRKYGQEAEKLLSRLGGVMVDLICAQEKAQKSPNPRAA